jgi:hypothetical protein
VLTGPGRQLGAVRLTVAKAGGTWPTMMQIVGMVAQKRTGYLNV